MSHFKEKWKYLEIFSSYCHGFVEVIIKKSPFRDTKKFHFEFDQMSWVFKI